MTRGKVLLIVGLTAVLSGFVSWHAAKRFDPLLNRTIAINGEQQEHAPNGVDFKQDPSPTGAVSKCKIAKFKVVTATENGERAVARIGDLSPREFSCLLDVAQIEVPGKRPWRPFSVEQKPSYRPLYMTLEAAN